MRTTHHNHILLSRRKLKPICISSARKQRSKHKNLDGRGNILEGNAIDSILDIKSRGFGIGLILQVNETKVRGIKDGEIGTIEHIETH